MAARLQSIGIAILAAVLSTGSTAPWAAFPFHLEFPPATNAPRPIPGDNFAPDATDGDGDGDETVSPVFPPSWVALVPEPCSSTRTDPTPRRDLRRLPPGFSTLPTVHSNLVGGPDDRSHALSGRRFDRASRKICRGASPDDAALFFFPRSAEESA